MGFETCGDAGEEVLGEEVVEEKRELMLDIHDARLGFLSLFELDLEPELTSAVVVVVAGIWPPLVGVGDGSGAGAVDTRLNVRCSPSPF